MSEVLKDSTPLKENQFVYVTNDEKIKDGEYGLCVNLVNEGFKAEQAVFRMNDEQRGAMVSFGGQKEASILKVLLTNDTSLIADGVEEINSSFLSFFAENQSDYVEITKMLQVRHGVDWHDLPKQTEGRGWNGIYRHIYKLNFAEKDKKEEKSLEANKQFIKNTSPEKLESLMKEFDNYEVEDWISPMQKFRKKEKALKSIEQKAVDFAGNRKLGGEHGFPSHTAHCLEKGFLKGYKTAVKDLKTEKLYTKQDLDFELNKLLNEVLITKRFPALINNPDSNKIAYYLNNRNC